MKKSYQYYIRKSHRYLGVLLGIQFFFWTIGGLYFSFTSKDDIHGDSLINEKKNKTFIQFADFVQIDPTLNVSSFELRFILGTPYYWINKSQLINARSGEIKKVITEQEAKSIARAHIKDRYKMASTEYITEVGSHHEYRGKPLPAWAIHFRGGQNLAVYVAENNGSIQRVRTESWRWFDFFWMMHSMDYQGRDDFRNTLVRFFSLFGLITISSGFVLLFVTRKRRRRRAK
jgi:uncharacterized iron-regulated membrane protein